MESCWPWISSAQQSRHNPENAIRNESVKSQEANYKCTKKVNDPNNSISHEDDALDCNNNTGKYGEYLIGLMRREKLVSKENN